MYEITCRLAVMAALLVSSCAVLASAVLASSPELDRPMQFRIAYNGGNCSTCTWIAAQGTITPDTHLAFETFLVREGMPDARGLNIHINSPGGNLFGGVRLGTAIRNSGANTIVSASHGNIQPNGWLSVTESSYDTVAVCASACAFAFAGPLGQGSCRLI